MCRYVSFKKVSFKKVSFKKVGRSVHGGIGDIGGQLEGIGEISCCSGVFWEGFW